MIPCVLRGVYDRHVLVMDFVFGEDFGEKSDGLACQVAWMDPDLHVFEGMRTVLNASLETMSHLGNCCLPLDIRVFQRKGAVDAH